jgi:SAM-dependent methyltransferase
MTMAVRTPDPNYRWWSDHGQAWPGEVERRKGYMPIYSIQEVLLAEYLSRNAPARVLEFGCGFGRHLAYLSRVPGLTVAGCDQSPSMVDGMRDWATEEWIAENVRITPPLDPLPYPDKSFDVVFSVSVLIHVRPEHVPGILRELARVSRWQIIHIENNRVADSELTAEAHDGCWAHPLVQHYSGLGLRAEVLPKPFDLEDLYRVVLDAKRPVADLDAVTLGNFLKLDRATTAHIAALGAELAGVRKTLEDAEAREAKRLRDMQQLWADNARLVTVNKTLETSALTAEVDRLRARCRELEDRLAEQEARVSEHSAFVGRLAALLDGPR